MQTAAKQALTASTGRMAERVRGFGESVFSEMTRLAIEHNAVNLSQGFPDFPAPEWLKEAAREAIAHNINQYAPSHGSARLRHAIAAKMSATMRIEWDPDTEITVTNGATEAIYDIIQALVNPGDEVVLFEPFYDSYVPATEIAGGIPRIVTLHAPDWHFDPSALEAAFSERTRAILLNTPHNPTGKVFTRDELTQIAALCQRHDSLAITDEVYEHLLFDGNEHISVATLPGMRDRTVTINSASKTFSVTGWKAGYVVAPADLTNALRRIHQFVTFCSAAPLQEAVAQAIEQAPERGYYNTFRADYAQRLDTIMDVLDKSGLKPVRPQGTFFVMSDISELGFADDIKFAR